MQYRKSVFRSLAMVTQLGLSVVTPIFLCIFIGYQIDSHFEVKTLIPMLILGVLAGGRCAWRLAMNTLEQDCREERKLREELKSRSLRTGISKPKQASRIRKSGENPNKPERDLVWGINEGHTADREADENGVAEKINKTASL